MKCPQCATKLRRVAVSIWGAKNKALSDQCPKCDYFEFEPTSSQRVIDELKRNAGKIKRMGAGLRTNTKDEYAEICGCGREAQEKERRPRLRA